MNMERVASTNPLAPGVYRIELFSPTANHPDVRDGLPVFAKWRKANAARVRVLEASTKATEPQLSSVTFEVLAPPGAFPFGQLGYPAFGGSVGAGLPSFFDIATFLLDPLSSLESAVAEAAATFLLDASKPELQQLRAAINVARANILIIRGTLEAVRNGTAPDPASALGAAKNLAKGTLEILLSAVAAIPIAFPRNVVNRVVNELQSLITAIEEAPAKALKLARDAATDLVLPFEAANVGGLAFALAAAYVLWSGKRSKATDNVMLIGGAVALLGGGTLISNVLRGHDALHPKGS
jgi:hypothetical protein